MLAASLVARRMKRAPPAERIGGERSAQLRSSGVICRSAFPQPISDAASPIIRYHRRSIAKENAQELLVNVGLLVICLCSTAMSTTVYRLGRVAVHTLPEKPRDRARTRDRILQSARSAFAREGYARANVRDIAAQAGITAALVVRYFGSKDQLFAEAVAESFDLEQAFANIEHHALGDAFADLLFSEQREDDLMAIMVRASLDPAVHPVARQLAQDRMLAPMAALIGGSDALWRASLILSLATGLWLFRFLLPLAPLAEAVHETSQRDIAAMFQRIIDNHSHE